MLRHLGLNIQISFNFIPQTLVIILSQQISQARQQAQNDSTASSFGLGWLSLTYPIHAFNIERKRSLAKVSFDMLAMLLKAYNRIQFDWATSFYIRKSKT